MTEPESPLDQVAGPDQLLEAPAPGDEARTVRAAPDDARLVEDRYIGVRVEHTVPPEGPLPPEQASHAGELMTGELDDGPRPQQPSPPPQDVKITLDEPSVHEMGVKPQA